MELKTRQNISPTKPLACDDSPNQLTELRQQDHWLSHNLNVMPSGVIVLDGSGRIKTVS